MTLSFDLNSNDFSRKVHHDEMRPQYLALFLLKYVKVILVHVCCLDVLFYTAYCKLTHFLRGSNFHASTVVQI